MSKKIVLCIAVLLSVALLCGCSPFFSNNVEELLVAPQLSVTQQKVLKSLTDHVGETVELKYPRDGEYLSPFLFYDLDADGSDEAIVLYTSQSKGKNVQLALLQKKESGKWVVVFDANGINTDIDSVAFANILPGDEIQIIVGYTSLNLSDKYLVVYSCQDLTLQVKYEQGYYRFGVADITGNGQMDLVAVSSPTQLGRLQLSLVTAKDGQIVSQYITNLDTAFTSCTNFSISKTLWRGRCVVVDGYVSTHSIASEVLYYSGEKFVRCISESGKTIPFVTEREHENLLSMDLDDDGTIEVPVVDDNTEFLPEDQRFCWISWYEFEQNNAYEDTFGVADIELGYFISLPIKWKDKISLSQGPNAGQWILRDIETNQVYMFIQALEQGEKFTSQDSQKYEQVATTGNYRIFIYIVEDNIGTVNSLQILNGVKNLS